MTTTATTADNDVTIAEIREFMTRQRQALSEAGRPDLAETAHIVVTDDAIKVVCADIPVPDRFDPDLLKAVSIDPVFEHRPEDHHP